MCEYSIIFSIIFIFSLLHYETIYIKKFKERIKYDKKEIVNASSFDLHKSEKLFII